MAERSRLQRQRALQHFRDNGGMLRMSEALRCGLSRGTLYGLYDSGEIVRMGRGLYRLTELPPLSEHDLVIVATRVPRGILCLISALSYHGITTEIPHEVYLALPPGTWRPRLAYPPIRTFRFSGDTYTAGVEQHTVDGVALQVYSAAKTVADCFRFRNKIGIDVAVEALRYALERRKATRPEILHFASIDRVERVIIPFIQATS